MTASSLMSTYLGVGTHAARPVTPNVLSGVTAVYYETDTTNTFIWNGAAWVQVNGGGGSVPDYILIQDQKTSGTGGGTFTSGAWRTRDLNTIVSDSGGHATLSSNQITLDAGTYEFMISAPAYFVNRHACRFYNVTDSALIADGTGEYNNTAVQTRSICWGKFVIGASKHLEIQHQSESTQNSIGFGVNMGGTFAVGHEIYTTIELWKVA